MTSTAHIVPTHTAPFLVSESACPKCRWRNANERLSCSSCGLVFAKYAVRHPRQSSQGHGAREQHLPIVAIALPLPHESPRDSSGLELDWSRVSHRSRAATATTSDVIGDDALLQNDVTMLPMWRPALVSLTGMVSAALKGMAHAFADPLAVLMFACVPAALLMTAVIAGAVIFAGMMTLGTGGFFIFLCAVGALAIACVLAAALAGLMLIINDCAQGLQGFSRGFSDAMSDGWDMSLRVALAAVLAACFVAVPALTVMWLVREAQVGPWMLAGAATAFVAAARAVFALPAAVLDGCGPMQALQKSIALTRGRTLTLLAVMLLLSALLCVGAVVTSLLLNMGPMGFVAAVIAQLPMFVAMVGALVAMWRACQPVPAV